MRTEPMLEECARLLEELASITPQAAFDPDLFRQVTGAQEDTAPRVLVSQSCPPAGAVRTTDHRVLHQRGSRTFPGTGPASGAGGGMDQRNLPKTATIGRLHHGQRLGSLRRAKATGDAS